MLRDVLLGSPDAFRWLGEENAQYSALVRDTLRRGYRFDRDLALRQHAEMVDAYRQAGVAVHLLDASRGAALRRLRARLELHDAVRRRGHPAGEPAAAWRVRERAAVLPVARHPGLRPGVGRELRGRRLQHDRARLRADRLHRAARRGGCGAAGRRLDGGRGHRGALRADRRVLRPHRPDGLHAGREARRRLPRHDRSGHRRLDRGEGDRGRPRQLPRDDGPRLQRRRPRQRPRAVLDRGARAERQAAGAGLRGLRPGHEPVPAGRRRRALHVPAAAPRPGFDEETTGSDPVVTARSG